MTAESVLFTVAFSNSLADSTLLTLAMYLCSFVEYTDGFFCQHSCENQIGYTGSKASRKIQTLLEFLC